MKEEAKIESYYRLKAKKLGCLVLKFVSPMYNGVPDRITLIPDGTVIFIEFKAPGKEPKPLQKSIHKLFRRLNQKVYIVDSKEKAKQILDGIQRKRLPEILY